MKKVLLMSLAAAFSFTAFAQEEEDVTNLITNAGFDTGFTFTDEGRPASETTLTGETSSRSRWSKSANGDYYAEPTDGKGFNIVGNNSWYGFLGAPAGWTVAKDYVTTKPEWKYFGVIPYSVKEGYLGCGDGNPAGSIVAPVKPANDDTDDNLGFLYMRAGWNGAVVYEQKVSLPCAKYRIEYYSINLNPSASVDAKDLTQVVCRKEVFRDETGFSNSSEWVKHEFEFTPTSDFTLQFGFQSANSTSNTNPIIAIDGIKLYKTGEASLEEIYATDLNDLYEEFFVISENYADYGGIAAQADAAVEAIEDAQGLDADGMKAAIDKYTALKDSIYKTVELVPSITAAYDKAMAAAEKAYPGLSSLEVVTGKYDEVINGGTWEEIAAYATELKEAYLSYMMSQNASVDTPADYTFLVQNPLFVKEGHEPTVEDGVFTYPDQDSFETGKAPEVATSEGWMKTGTQTGGDQRLNYAQSRVCWNAWANNADGKTLEVSQKLTNLPNGYYKVSGDLITQDGYANDQHVFGTSALQTGKSGYLESGLWDSENNAGAWTTLTTDKVLVHDGQLTIGASGTLANSNQSGWFCVTNFQLYYLGAATQAEVEAALAAKAENAKTLVAAMHFGADKATANDSIAAYTTTGDLATLNAAIKLAETSEAKYEEIYSEGKTIPTVKSGVADGTYDAATEIVQSGIDNTEAYITTGSYSKVDSVLNILKAYVDPYAPAYNNANELVATFTSATAKEALSNTMANHKAKLTAALQSEAYVKAAAVELAAAAAAAQAQDNFENNPSATDYTGFIMNALSASTDGWNVIKGEGDGPVKKGQYFTDDANRNYFDTWNGTAGKNNFYMDQTIKGLPNGTYTLAANVRTANEGAFIFAATGVEAADTTWMEIPVQTYTYYDETAGKDSTVTATDKYGKLWEEAKEKIGNMSDKDPEYATVQATYNANGGNGRGWMNLQVPGIVVNNHELTIGMTCDSTKTHKAFTGTWFSATDFTLTLTKAGDNTGWNGPVTGITEISNEALKADAIYNINGQRINSMKQGLYIVVRNGKAVKVIKK